jgi:hypothetical protein
MAALVAPSNGAAKAGPLTAVCREASHPDVSFAGVLVDGGAEVDLATCLGPGDQEAEDGGRRTSLDTT